jgi:CheY-like chemotaxis protein
MSVAFALAVARDERPDGPSGAGDPPPLAALGESSPRQMTGPPAPSPRASRRILVADDNEPLRHSLAEMLSAEGYGVVEAAHGRRALEMLAASPFDVLILDLAMPEMDGVELLRRIDPPPPAVIIHSAFEYLSPERVRAEAGAKVFRSLRKPVAPLELLEVVAEALEELGRGNR